VSDLIFCFSFGVNTASRGCFFVFGGREYRVARLFLIDDQTAPGSPVLWRASMSLVPRSICSSNDSCVVVAGLRPAGARF
jgi:hypothetical protein